MIRFAAVLAIAAACAALSFRNIYEPDLWWHLAQGREDVAGRVVRTNVFSFSHPDYRQHYTPWLFDAAVYAVWKVGGGAAIQTLQAALLAFALWCVFAACRTRAPAVAASAVLIVGFFVVEPRAQPRPYLVSFAGLAVCMLLIERAAAQKRAAPLAWAIPVIAVWSNLHVECVFGVIVLALFAAAELIRPAALARREASRALGIAALCAVVTLANPYGWGLWRYLYENVSVPQILDIAELRPPYLPTYRAFFLYVSAGAALLLLFPRTLVLWEAVIAVFVAILGLRYLRLTPLLFFVTAPMLAARIGFLIARGLDSRAILATALVAGVLFSRVPVRAYATGLRAGTRAVMPSSFFSLSAVEFVRREGLTGPLFNSNNLGGFIEWTMYPDARPFQDGRLQAYPPGHFRTILEASRSQADWDRLVAGVDWSMLSRPRPYTLSGAGLFPHDEWATVFWDEAVEVLVRRKGRFARIAAEREYQFVTSDAAPFVLVAQLSSDRGDRIREEARRNRAENPDGFTAAVVMCLAGDAASCARVDRFGEEREDLKNAVRLVRDIKARGQ